MAYSQTQRKAVRTSYINDRLDLKTAALMHDIPYGTARNWKKAAEQQGDNWDRARNASRMAQGSIGDLTQQVLEDFAMQSLAILDEIKENDKLSASQKTDMMAKLSDSYVKITKAAGGSDKKLAKLSIAMTVIKLLANFVADKYPHHAEHFNTILESFGPVVSESLSNG